MLLLTSLKNALSLRITVTNLHCTDLTTVINLSRYLNTINASDEPLATSIQTRPEDKLVNVRHYLARASSRADWLQSVARVSGAFVARGRERIAKIMSLDR